MDVDAAIVLASVLLWPTPASTQQAKCSGVSVPRYARHKYRMGCLFFRLERSRSLLVGPDSKSVDKKRKAVVAAVAAENDEIKIFMEREMVVAQWKKVPTIAQLWLRK